MAEGSESSGVLRELLAVFGFGVNTDELKKGESELDKFLGRVSKAVGAFAGLFAVHEIGEFVEANARAMSGIEHAASRIGITTERVQEFQFAARAMGEESETLLAGMGRLQVSAQAAAAGNQTAAKSFSDLGVHTRDANGHIKAADELLLDVADGIAKQTDASKQAALATALFGRSGRELLPFLKEGRKGFNELVKEYRELGGGYSERALKASKDYEKQQARLNLSTTALKSTILAGLLPVWTKLVAGATAIVHWFVELAKQSYIVEAALGVLGAVGAVFAVQMAIANAPLLLMAAALAAVVLAVDDFVTMMEGGDSEIGAVIDKYFGKDAHLEVVRELRDIWHEIRDFVHEVAESARELDRTWGNVKDKIYGAFGYERAGGEGSGMRKVVTQHGFYYEPETRPMFGPQIPSTSNTVNVTVHTPPGLNEKQVGEHVATKVHQVLKGHYRAAAATHQRAPATKE